MGIFAQQAERIMNGGRVDVQDQEVFDLMQDPETGEVFEVPHEASFQGPTIGEIPQRTSYLDQAYNSGILSRGEYEPPGTPISPLSLVCLVLIGCVAFAD